MAETGNGSKTRTRTQKDDPEEKQSTARTAVDEVPGDVVDEATSEQDGPEAKEVEWRGVQITLPAELPAEVLFDIVDIEGANDPLAILRMLKSLVGAGAFAGIRQVVADEGGDFAVALEAVGVVTSAFGIGLGESSASQEH